MWEIRFAFPDLVCLDTPIDEQPDALLCASMILTAERFMSASEFDSDSYPFILNPSFPIKFCGSSPDRNAARADQSEASAALHNSG